MRPSAQVLTAVVCALATVTGAGACKEKNKQRADPRPSAPDDASMVAQIVDAAPAPPDHVDIFLDDEPVTTIAAAELAQRQPLAKLVSASRETWLMVEASGPGSRYTSLYKPHEKHPNARIYIYTDAKGIPAFGLFEKGADQPTVLERRIDRVNVATRTPNRAAPVPIGLFVLGRVGQPSTMVNDTTLESLPEATMPGGETDGRGWYLRDVVALVPDANTATTVRIKSADEEPVDLAMSLVQDANFATYLKRNRRGQWRLKTWSKQPDGSAKLVHSLRSVTGIELR